MDYKIIDFHAHAFPDKIADRATEHLRDYYKMPLVSNGLIDDLIHRANDANIEKIVILASATKPDQVENVNNYIYELTKKYQKTIGFGSIHPNYKNYENELERIKELGIKGIKLHADFQNFPIDSPEMMPIYKKIVELNMPILFHLGDRKSDKSSSKRLARLLDVFPDMIAIGAHLGGVYRWEESYKYLVGRNLYFDTSSTLHELSYQAAADIINSHGDDKILFGTDFPLSDYEIELERFMKIPLTDEQRHKILYKNAYSLLGLLNE